MTEFPSEHENSSGVAQCHFFLVFLEVCTSPEIQEHIMNEHDYCTSGVCLETSEKSHIVSIYVDYTHPLLPSRLST